MKPFDIKAAKEGAKVQTRDGKQVTQLAFFKLEDGERVAGVLDGVLVIWNATGLADYFGQQYPPDKRPPQPRDLFMVPVEAWVNLYKDNATKLSDLRGFIHPSEAAANRAHELYPEERVACVRIEL